ncbi:unnamed protein product [Lactuca virosa]|uniref:Uncharacterized protein n=1 Tax=Lactuca virosa TaxID=75947 RepID=A0AAU9PKD7_9ASTR|nr:unnamed protein product [Lactuca virosa]
MPRLTIQSRNRFTKLSRLPNEDYRYGLEFPVLDVNHPIHGEDDVPDPTEDDVGVIQPNPAENDVRFQPYPFIDDESELGED